MEEQRNKRLEREQSSNQQLGKILTKEKKKQLILNKILQQNHEEYE